MKSSGLHMHFSRNRQSIGFDLRHDKFYSYIATAIPASLSITSNCRIFELFFFLISIHFHTCLKSDHYFFVTCLLEKKEKINNLLQNELEQKI